MIDLQQGLDPGCGPVARALAQQQEAGTIITAEGVKVLARRDYPATKGRQTKWDQNQ